MVDHVTIRRWSLKPGHDEKTLLSFVSDDLAPAWRKIPGCLSLNFLRVNDGASYLAVTYWESKTYLERWTGPEGQAWRDTHHPILERWLEFMAFQDELEAELLVIG